MAVDKKTLNAKAQYSVFVETMLDGLVLLDRAMNIQWANQAFTQILGSFEVELAGKSFLDIVDDSQMAKALEQFWRHLHGERGYFETLLGIEGGRKVPVRMSGVPYLDDQSQICGVLICVTDLTEQKETESLYKAQGELMAEIQASVISVDREGRVTTWNSEAVKTFGYSVEEALNQDLFNLLKTPVPNQLKEIWTQVQKFNPWQGEIEIQDFAQNPYVFWANFTPLRDERGEIKGMVGVLQDITCLVRAQQQNQETNQGQNEFLAKMSHEFRTPLGGILGFTELLARETLSPRLQEIVNSIQICGFQLSELINNILDFSKLEAKQINLQIVNFEVDSLLQDCLGIIQAQLGETQVELSSKIDHHVPPVLQGDIGKIRQILINLLGNAVKFTKQGRIEVRFSRGEVKALSANSLLFPLLVTVRDTGIGIRPEVQERIFAPFIQGEPTTTRKYGGTGLGLAISRQLIELMGGKIWVESEPGQGATFYFLIPLPIDTSTPSTRNAPSSSGKRRKPSESFAENSLYSPNLYSLKSVLVAEDNALNRKLITLILRDAGYQVLTVENGQECLTHLSQEGVEVDILLLDMQMPILDGYATCSRIRQSPRWRELPILALTAYALGTETEKCLQVGCNAFLTKPFTREQLLSTLQQLTLEQETAAQKKENQRIRQEQLLQELIPELLASLTEMLEQMHLALEQENWVKILDLSHDIKGAAGLYGLKEVSGIASQVNQEVKHGKTKELNRLVQELQESIAFQQEKQRLRSQ